VEESIEYYPEGIYIVCGIRQQTIVLIWKIYRTEIWKMALLVNWFIKRNAM